MALGAILGPLLAPASAGEVTRNSFLPPSSQHLFGTDLNGRDLLYRVLLGARISLLVGVIGASISFIVGIVYGMIAGYLGGRVDSVMMRFVDVLYSIPRLIFLLVLISALDPLLRRQMEIQGLQQFIGYSKIVLLIVSLGLTEWLTMARIMVKC
jgi:peptide/nickel transport system permease protein/oligopeptide transport system permease protein